MHSNIVITHEAKVKINGIAFGVRRPRVRIEAADHETGNTETGQFERRKTGRLAMAAEMEFYEDGSLEYHAAPLNIIVGQQINLQFYNRGLSYAPYACSTFVLHHFEVSGDINSPLSGSFAGRSDGTVTVP